jgi:nitrous oxide reductase accessory protein NosL
MKRFVILAVTCWTLLACALAGATDLVEGPPSCKQCGMDRTANARSRVLITYDDGTTAGLCSIHCAAEDMKQNAGKQVKSIMVADYGTKELTDARSATWVIGGEEKGVMTSEPKWAFAKAEDAHKFVAGKGGRIATFDEALKAAQAESGVACACEGPGGHMLFNPAFGDDIYHTHPAGMWMVSMKEMHMAMDGLRDGTTNVSTKQVGNNRGLKYDNYMMIPTSMHMDMQMLMVMYGITDRWTVMAMANYLETKMDMVMDMSPFNMMGMPKAVDPGAQADDPMRTSGLSDTELRGIYKLTEYMNASLGLSLPTGDIDQDFTTMGTKWRAPYDMQLGSGTFDLKPAVTLNFLSDDALWNWGGQAMYTAHLGKNSNDYSLGDSLKLNTWLQRALGPAATWIRLSYSDTGSINGHDDEIQKSLNLKGPLNPTGNYMAPAMPDADPNNYGGQRIDGFVGFSIPVKAVSFGVEAGVPLYQDLNGLQMKNDWYLTAGIQTMF